MDEGKWYPWNELKLNGGKWLFLSINFSPFSSLFYDFKLIRRSFFFHFDLAILFLFHFFFHFNSLFLQIKALKYFYLKNRDRIPSELWRKNTAADWQHHILGPVQWTLWFSIVGCLVCFFLFFFCSVHNVFISFGVYECYTFFFPLDSVLNCTCAHTVYPYQSAVSQRVREKQKFCVYVCACVWGKKEKMGYWTSTRWWL